MENELKESNKSMLPPDQALSAWEKICEGLYHFDNLSNKCRLLASTWLLASFAGIGFVSTKTLPIKPEIVIPILSVFASSGILMLWTIDQLVYIRFIEAYFFEALAFEQRYEFLPKANDNMPLLFGKKGVISYVRIFYLGCMIAPMLLSLLALFPQTFLASKAFLYSLYCLALITLLTFGFYLFLKKPEYKKLLKKPEYKNILINNSIQGKAQQADLEKSE